MPAGQRARDRSGEKRSATASPGRLENSSHIEPEVACQLRRPYIVGRATNGKGKGGAGAGEESQ